MTVSSLGRKLLASETKCMRCHKFALVLQRLRCPAARAKYFARYHNYYRVSKRVDIEIMSSPEYRVVAFCKVCNAETTATKGRAQVRTAKVTMQWE